MNEQIQWVLELLPQPAFFVQEGVVVWRNAAAQELIPERTSIQQLLGDNAQLVSLWSREGQLKLSLVLKDAQFEVSVRAVNGMDLFIADTRVRSHDATAEALINASVCLRKPLHSMVGAARELFDLVEEQENPAAIQAANVLNQNMYQMMRLCGQMSDGGQLLQRRHAVRMQRTELRAYFDDIAAQARPLVEDAGRQLRYVGLTVAVNGNIDRTLLERAVYNLLSNALNYSAKGDTVALIVEQRERMLVVRVGDSGEGIAPEVMAMLFERYSEHSVGDSRWGLGLGLPMVREIAQLHGGTAMVSGSDERKGTTAMFSMSLENAPPELHSGRLQYDNWSGFHPGLVELSDVLPSSVYNPAIVL